MKTTKGERRVALEALGAIIDVSRRALIRAGNDALALAAGAACEVMVNAFADAERCADLEAQLQQSRDDYETALREGEKLEKQLRDAQHDANNASMLRDAAELARSERDRVEGENVKLRAGMEKVRNAHSLFDTYLGNASYMASGLGRAAMSARQLLSEALSIAGVERG